MGKAIPIIATGLALALFLPPAMVTLNGTDRPPAPLLDTLRFELVRTVGPLRFVMDYDLTLGDCVNRWDDPEFAGMVLSCERAGETR